MCNGHFKIGCSYQFINDIWSYMVHLITSLLWCASCHIIFCFLNGGVQCAKLVVPAGCNNIHLSQIAMFVFSLSSGVCFRNCKMDWHVLWCGSLPFITGTAEGSDPGLHFSSSGSHQYYSHQEACTNFLYVSALMEILMFKKNCIE